MDFVLYRRLVANLLKSNIIKVDLKFLNGRFLNNIKRNYNTQSIEHSTHIPPKLQTDIEPSSIYVNPICMQLDQLMFNCSNHEELLNLLVTHRGAMYLHNLVTVMKLLRNFVEADDKNKYSPDCDDLFLGYNKIFQKKQEPTQVSIESSNFSENEAQLIDKAKSELVSHFQDPRNQEYLMVQNHNRDLKDAIIRDERYDLLLQDLYVNKNKLDIVSICNIIITLDALEHKYFRLYNGLLKRLLGMDISFSDQSPAFVNDVAVLLLKTCQCYARSGFYDIPLYNKLTNELIRNNLLNLMNDSDNHKLLAHIIRLYGLVKSYDFSIFSKISESIETLRLSPSELSWLAQMFSNHLNFHKVHDRVMYHVAQRISADGSSFTLRQLCTCISSFSKMKLYFGDAWRICTTRLTDDIEISLNGYDDVDLEIKTLCKAVHDIATVDNTSHLVHSLIDKASLYLEQRIDDLDEESSIKMAVSMVAIHSSLNDGVSTKFTVDSTDPEPIDETAVIDAKDINCTDDHSPESTNTDVTDLETISADNMSNLNTYLLSYIWRRIGSDVAWEREPLKVFAVWLYHMIVFPHFKHNIHKRCIIPCFREWLLVYNTRHEILDEVSKIAKELFGKFKIYTKFDEVDPFKQLLESPVPVDLLVIDENFGNKAINIVDSVVRNDRDRATGVDLVVKGILEHFGLEVHFVDTHLWVSLDTAERTRLVESLIVNGCY